MIFQLLWIFRCGKMKSAIDFSEIVEKWLSNQEMQLKPLTTDQIKNLTIIKTIIDTRIMEIRDELVKIRVLMDENSMKAKQFTTNLIKELK